MMDCAYIGDSIAVGLQQLDNECAIHARVGAGSGFITQRYSGNSSQDYVIISMGSNDPNNPSLVRNARALRRSLKAEVVIWIIPYNHTAARAIESVAKEFSDGWVALRYFPSRDNVHPQYRPVARSVQQAVLESFD
jgi:hypothetical protein